jgi:serine protease AprX
MPYHFRPNYPAHHTAAPRLLTTPERVNAIADFTGRGIVMAFIDAGFYAHPDLGTRILAHVDCTTPDFAVRAEAIPTAERFVWHGMMSSVIGCGDGQHSGGIYRGIACEAELVLIKVSSPDEKVKEADILRGLNWLLKNHRRYQVRVVNVSVGGDFVNSSPDHALHRAVADLVAAGIVVVIAAGNAGERHLLPPASSPEAIVVGGYNDANTLNQQEWTLYHSNYGVAHDLSPKPDVVAPAQWVASPILPISQVAKEARWLGTLLESLDTQAAVAALLRDGRADLHLAPDAHPGDPLHHKLEHRLHELKLINAHYQHVDGTSVAAPIVSSIVAQMLQANPHLTPAQVSTIVRHSAAHIHNVPPQKQGSGALDARQAVEAAWQMNQTTIHTLPHRLRSLPSTDELSAD